jgi:NAD(P)-dependent dehydrogenase (short-subunit alcohol dehydrogenase family)
MADKRVKKYNNPFSATFTGIKDLFRKNIPSGELKPEDRLDGKTVLIDGASSGLGFAVALDVAKRGAKVIMACRSGIPEKGDKVKKLSGSGTIYMLHVDFSDLISIQTLVKNVHEQFGKIDILICNAGIVPKKSRRTKQGLEEMFLVNYLSKFHFVDLLLMQDCFKTTGPGLPRIIFVSSEAHRNPKEIEWDAFGIYKEYSIGKSVELYGYYKLLLTTFAVELSRRLNAGGAKYSVFTLCPGPINSNIGREAPKIFLPLMKLVFALFFKSPEKAAVPVIYLAASADLENKPFDYFFLMTRKEPSDHAVNLENGSKLWTLSEQVLEKAEG